MSAETDKELLAEHEAWVAEQMRSSDPAVVLAVVMQCHLPVKLPDDSVMCLCHRQGKERPHAIFLGPAYHRRHVAMVQVAALRSSGHL